MNGGKRDLVVKVLRTSEEVESQVAGMMTGTAADINERCGVARPNVLSHLRAMQVAQQVHIHSWARSGTNWVARWAVGPGKDAPYPKISPEERQARDIAMNRERRQREREARVRGEDMTPKLALKLTNEFLARAKATPATWYSPLTMRG